MGGHGMNWLVGDSHGGDGIKPMRRTSAGVLMQEGGSSLCLSHVANF